MRRFALPLLAASSLLLVVAASAATRPHYGGILRVALRAAPASLDPADPNQPGSLARSNISRLMFDTLVTLDNRGRLHPSVATSWEAEPGNQRWHVYLRRGLSFHDGSAVTSDAVAASLRAANPTWKIFPLGDAVVIECDAPDPNLPAELALSRNGIAKRDGKLLGTGPFAVADWQPGKKLTLTARDDYWGGRPFVDSIVIEMGKSFRDQMISLDLGKADLIEVAPEQAHRAAMENRSVQSSAPLELMALVFTRDRQSAEEGRLRQALVLSIDRAAMNTVLLQGGGEPAGGLLPNWMSGYAFLFTTDVNLPQARQVRGEVRQASPWTLGYDPADPVARVVAERVALNARDAGLSLQLSGSNSADLRLVRVPLVSLDPRVALASLATALGLPQPKFPGDSGDSLYAAETALLDSQRVIPLLHVRVAAGIGPTVRNWTASADGIWPLQDVWLSAEKP
ncbi:MAG: ABC transporter substrate-binding protein [Acidobacteriia bacterium]|nr:ABC transporter substrate-binding protein [Terriglobia bacterium]